MNKFLVVFKHSFLTNVKSKSFIITTLISMILIFGLFALSTFISNLDEKESAKQIGIVDSTGSIVEPLSQQFEASGDNIELISYDSEEAVKEKYESQDIESYLIINQTDNNMIDATYKAEKITNSDLISKIEQALSQLQFKNTAVELGLSEVEIGQLFQQVSLEKVALGENAKSESELVQSFVLVYIILFAMYFAVLMYSNMVASEVAKEKSSRIMEILISSANPLAQMFGKILGISLLGVVQISSMLLVGIICINIFPNTISIGSLSFDFSQIPASMILYAILFYILGYLLYASIAAMLGSLVSRIEDLQQMVGPYNMVLIAAFMIAMFGLSNPDSSFIVGSSFFPLFTPMIMFLRVGMSDPAFWEIWLSIGVLVITIIIISTFAAKVYKGGVLMYGKSGSLKNTIKNALSFDKESR